MDDAIRVLGLSKRYPLVRRYREMLLHPFATRHLTALRDVSFSVRPGEVFGLLGPNGAGKTTLLKILAGLILPDGGTAAVNGRDVDREAALARRDVGLVITDERSFYWRLTGRQNLAFFGTLEDIPPPAVAGRVAAMLAFVGLEADADRMVKDYSAGMRHRLGIARGLLRNPQVLLFDEPTATIDPALARELRAFIRETLCRGEGRTVCLATHNLPEAEAVCDRIAILHRGRVRACDTPAGLKGLLRAPVLHDLLLFPRPGGGERLEDCLSRHGRSLVSLSPLGSGVRARVSGPSGEAGDIAPLVDLLAHSGFTVSSCASVEPTLEDVFARFTSEELP